MGKLLFENFSVAREVFEEAGDAVRMNLRKLCFDGPESDILLTENTQPCLLTTSVAAFRVAEKELEFKPSLVAGHSLGEYSALVAAGALSLNAAVRWVRERGLAMQKAVPAGAGAMAAVMGLDDAGVQALCNEAEKVAREKRGSVALTDDPDADPWRAVEVCAAPANYNAPGQIVISGSADAIQEALVLSKSSFSGSKLIFLPVSAPFHCRLMAPARDRMAEIFANASAPDQPRDLKCWHVPNRTGRPTREKGVILELLIQQVDHPVLWRQTVEAIAGQIAEVGSKAI
ncbi:MAG: ACP S-malonyltransferase, partial [Bdellovibrionota bacterium]